MIAHGKDIKIFSGTSNRPLAEAICKELGTELGNAEVGAFSDGENFVSIYETVRGSDVFVVQSTCSPVNDNLMELLIMIDALKRASAGRITAVMPYFGYARQDRKTKPRDPISAKLVANLITRAGADRVLTMDLHANQIQGFFDIPVDNLLGNPIFTNYLHDRFNGSEDDVIVVSPDVGSVARARAFAQKLGMGLAIVDKRRQKANSSEVMNIIGEVEGKHVILLDDMVDTGGKEDAVLAVHIADDVHHLALVGLLAALVHDGQIHVQLLGEGPGPGHGAHVGGDHHHVLAPLAELLGVVVHEDGVAVEVVHGNVKEALDLGGVEVHGQHPVRPGGHQHVGHQLGGDGVPGLGLPVLTCVAEVGDHRGDPAGGGPLHGVDHHQQLHQVVVDRAAGGLDEEYVGASDGLVDGGAHLAVGEVADLRVPQLNADELADVLGKAYIGVPAEDLHILTV